ncbi:adenosylcobinamide-GDP ribazoletransferase [Sulfitobacter sp.]|uniref:adenosylcobinamide-GDP ribazoletransferase n=1 Tax=Sulfitobacter sp. TaxID=1903071 RepID=UPI00300278F1
MDKSDRGRQLWLAAVLLTRVPLPHLPNDAFSKGADAVWAYPLIGVAVGAGAVLVGQLALWFGLPVYGAAALTLTTMMLLTGAMHEDGLADVFDGFWGGYTPERRLEIMRDSQIGTFGVLALIMVSILRLSAIAALLVNWWPAIIVAAVLSRAVMPILMNTLPHARKDGLSHSVGQPTSGTTALAIGIGALLSLFMIAGAGVIGICAALAVAIAIALLAKQKIGGQTGDVLGTVQQLSEAAVLLCCAAML